MATYSNNYNNNNVAPYPTINFNNSNAYVPNQTQNYATNQSQFYTNTVPTSPYSNANVPSMEPPPSYQNINETSMNREKIFTNLMGTYEISEFFSSKLQTYLSMTKIVFVFDDSGSMNSILNDSPLNSGLLKVSRWDELKYFSTISIGIANFFNENGTDVYFLNRPMARNVRNKEDLEPYFLNKPNGYTPLARILTTVLANNSNLAERKLLIIIVTDGEPTDDSGRVDINGFKQVLKGRNPKTYTTIVSCTDEDGTMDYLNNWDRTIPRLDVVDDFRNEKKEILRIKGNKFKFSFGDYVAKSLIGSMDVELDKLDERNQDCCSIN